MAEEVVCWRAETWGQGCQGCKSGGKLTLVWCGNVFCKVDAARRYIGFGMAGEFFKEDLVFSLRGEGAVTNRRDAGGRETSRSAKFTRREHLRRTINIWTLL